jgi:Polysaccharide lyase/IPT/TIG domain
MARRTAQYSRTRAPMVSTNAQYDELRQNLSQRQSSGVHEHAAADERAAGTQHTGAPSTFTPARTARWAAPARSHSWGENARYREADRTVPARGSVAPAAKAARRERLRSWLTKPQHAVPGLGIVLTVVVLGAIILTSAPTIMMAQSAPESFAVPKGWTDNAPTQTLTAPNGFVVVKGFRTYVEHHAWDRLDWPVENERAVMVNGAPDGTEQAFVSQQLRWEPNRRGVYRVGSQPPPTVGTFSPLAAGVGSTLTVTGAYFWGASSVSFTGASTRTFHVVSATQLTVVVPQGATTGPLRVNSINADGVPSTTAFTVGRVVDPPAATATTGAQGSATSTPAPAPPATGGSGSTTSSVYQASDGAIKWNADFETGDLSQWYSTQTPNGSLSMVSSSTGPVGQGKHAVKAEIYANSSSGSLSRAELTSTQDETQGYIGQTWYYTWQMYFPSNPDAANGWSDQWNGLVQWMDTHYQCSPPLSVGISIPDQTGSTRYISIYSDPRDNLNGCSRLGPWQQWNLTPVRYDHWYTMTMLIHYSTDPSVGYAEAWLDGAQVLPLTHMRTVDHTGNYMEVHNYQGSPNPHSVVYFDSVYRHTCYALGPCVG